MEILIDDTSPQIFYGPRANGWTADHPGDPLTPQYFAGTFHATHTDGDYMRILFNGTGIRVYGAKRDNHGAYSVKLDNGTPELLLGLGDAALQAVLFEVGGLAPNKEHELTRPPPTATRVWYLDIDFIVIEQEKPGRIYTTAFDDTSDAIAYSPGWKTPTLAKAVRDQYFNGTVHQASSPGNSLKFPFNGTSLQVFGKTDKDTGRYSVQLDGTPVQVLNATSDAPQVNATLFWASGLTDGPHLLSITNVGGVDAQAANLEIDYIVVNSTTDSKALPPAPTTTGTATKTSTSVGAITRTITTTSSAPESSSGTTVPAGGQDDQEESDWSSAGAIAGGVLGALAGLVLLGLLACFCLRRKRKEREAFEHKQHMDLIATPVVSAFPYELSPTRYDPPSARSADYWPPPVPSEPPGGGRGGHSPSLLIPSSPQPYRSSPSPSPSPSGYASRRDDQYASDRGAIHAEEAIPPPLLSPVDLGLRPTYPAPPRIPSLSFQPWASQEPDDPSRQSQQLPVYAESDSSPLYGGVVFSPTKVHEKQPRSAPVAINPSRLSPSGNDREFHSASSPRIPVPALTRENSTSLPYAARPTAMNPFDPPRSS